MPRPDPKAPREGQDALFDAAETATERTDELRRGVVPRGRHSVEVDKALNAAHNRGLIEDVDGAGATLLRAVAANADLAESRHDLWALAKLLPGATDLLRDLHMTPESRQTNTDAEIAALIEALGKADAETEGSGTDVDGHPAIPHTPQ